MPNVSWWIIGDMAKEIAAAVHSDVTFYIVPERVFVRCAGLRNALLRHVHVLLFMDEAIWEGLDRLALPDGPAVVTWIHHVTKWSRRHELALRGSDAIVACTKEWADFIGRQTSQPPPVTVVPHAVDTTLFRPGSGSREAFGLPPSRFVIGFAGSRMSDQDDGRKGLPTLLQVIREAARQIPELHVAFSGMGWENEVRELRSSGVSASYLGFLKKAALPGFYRCLDAFLVTSRVEGGPVTVLESMACGTPVVATRVGLVPDVIVDYETGISAPVDDVPALVQSLVMLYRQPELRSKIARQAASLIGQTRTLPSTLVPLADCSSTLAQGRQVVDSLPREYGRSPQDISRAAHAADCLIETYGQMRRGMDKGLAALRRLPNILAGVGPADLMRGCWLLANREAQPSPRDLRRQPRPFQKKAGS